jgi:Uma2 family endonuclease
MSVQVERRQFNISEYARMGEAGIFSEDDRVELIEGEIIKMSPIGSHHAACVDRMVNTLLAHLANQSAIVRVQSPIVLDDYSEPQPDVTLLRLRADFYAQSHPTPEDVLLVVEVADSSIEIDRDVKLPLYARAGIRQVLLVNIPAGVIESYSQPTNGVYQSVRHLERGETVEIKSVPGLVLTVDAILG